MIETLKDYTKETLLGEGGFCEVYKVSDSQGNVYALKSLLRKQFHDHLRKEYSALLELNHRGIPKVYRLFAEDDTLHMVQEFIDGDLVSFTYDYDCKMPVREAKQLLQELLEIVQHIHSRGYVHCDIKPVNIIKRTDGHFVLIDFGAVAVAGEWRTSVGTPGFRPPEQNAGRAYPATDLYAIGIAIASLLTGEREEVFHEHGYQPVQLPKDLAKHDPILAQVLGRMTDPSLENRFRSAQEALAALEGRRVSAPTMPVQLDKTIKMGGDERDEYKRSKITRASLMLALLICLIYANIISWKPTLAKWQTSGPARAATRQGGIPSQRFLGMQSPGIAEAASLDPGPSDTTTYSDHTSAHPVLDSTVKATADAAVLTINEADVSGVDPNGRGTDRFADPERGKTVYFFAVLSRDPTQAETSAMHCMVSLVGPDGRTRTVTGGKLVGNILTIPYREATLTNGTYTWRVQIDRDGGAPLVYDRQQFTL